MGTIRSRFKKNLKKIYSKRNCYLSRAVGGRRCARRSVAGGVRGGQRRSAHADGSQTEAEAAGVASMPQRRRRPAWPRRRRRHGRRRSAWLQRWRRRRHGRRWSAEAAWEEAAWEEAPAAHRREGQTWTRVRVP
jgi:hypothetical protein